MKDERSRAEKVKALQGEIEDRLLDRGARRKQLLGELEEVERDIRLLALEGFEAGLTTRHMGSLIEMTSSGVSKWIAKARQEK